MQTLRFIDPGGNIKKGICKNGLVQSENSQNTYEFSQVTLLSPIEGLIGQFGALRAPRNNGDKLRCAAGSADVYRGQSHLGCTLICAALDDEGRVYSCAAGPVLYESEQSQDLHAQVWLSGKKIEGPHIELSFGEDTRFQVYAEYFEAAVGDIAEIRQDMHSLIVVISCRQHNRSI